MHDVSLSPSGGRLPVSTQTDLLDEAPEGITGLTADEVEERERRGETNAVQQKSSRSYAHIIRGNVFTRFNAILGSLFVVILVFGSPRDALFGAVLVVNTLIGIVQE